MEVCDLLISFVSELSAVHVSAMRGGVVIVNICLLRVPFDGSVPLFIGEVSLLPFVLLLGVESVMHIRVRMSTSVRSLRRVSVFFSSFCTFSCQKLLLHLLNALWLLLPRHWRVYFCDGLLCFLGLAVFVLAACFFAVCGVDACIVLSSIFLGLSFFWYVL